MTRSDWFDGHARVKRMPTVIFPPSLQARSLPSIGTVVESSALVMLCHLLAFLAFSRMPHHQHFGLSTVTGFGCLLRLFASVKKSSLKIERKCEEK